MVVILAMNVETVYPQNNLCSETGQMSELLVWSENSAYMNNLKKYKW